MDTFLYETNYLIYAMHIFYQLPFEAELIKEKERILLKSKNLPDVCEISFWKNNVIEIVIEQAKDMIYYLHFEFLTRMDFHYQGISQLNLPESSYE